MCGINPWLGVGVGLGIGLVFVCLYFAVREARLLSKTEEGVFENSKNKVCLSHNGSETWIDRDRFYESLLRPNYLAKYATYEGVCKTCNVVYRRKIEFWGTSLDMIEYVKDRAKKEAKETKRK